MTRALLFLGLSGCWSLNTPAMKGAVEAARSGDPGAAEAAWMASLDDEITLEEWNHARTRACRLRVDRIRPTLEGLESVTYEQAAELHRELAVCAEAGPLRAKLVELEAREATAALEGVKREPRAVARLTQALPHLAHLDAEAPDRGWFEAEREARRDAMLAGAESAKGPVTRAMFTQLAADAGHDGPSSVQDAAETVLAVQIDTVAWADDPSCASVLPSRTAPTRPSAPTTPVDVQVSARSCSSTVSVGDELETWTEIAYRSEVQDVERCQTVSITTVTPVTNVNCYTSLNAGGEVCTVVGSYTDRQTTTERNCWMEQETVQVPYEVEKSRTVYRATRHVSATLEVQVASPDGQDVFVVPYSASFPGAASTGSPVPPDAGATHATVRDALAQAALDQARTAARKWRVASEAAAGTDRSDPDRAREHLLAAMVGGSAPTAEDLAFMAEPFGLVGSELAGWASLPPLQLPPPYVPPGHPLSYRRPRDRGLVRDGYAPFLLSVGGLWNTTEDLVAQPKRTAAVGEVSGRSAFGLMSGPDANGLGLHVLAEGTFQLGARTSEGYDFPTDDAAEFPLAIGADVRVAAMLGTRSRRFAVFGGLMPVSSRLILGSQTSRGLAFPWVAHAELRLVERYPILATAWGYGLRTERSSTRGVRVDLPIGRGVWFSPRVEERVLRTNVKGLHPEDPVDAGFRSVQSLGAALSFEL
ncbi:MAG: hypothetical protein R3F61_26580 [Myxococcota bacterium]